MSYLFKAQAEDFCVQERLLVSPEGEGDVLWIQRQKIHLTTMEVIAHLLAHFPLTRKEIGIAGLKDKVGITTQRLTIYRSKLEICGGKEQFLAVLSEKVKILQIQWGKTALKI